MNWQYRASVSLMCMLCTPFLYGQISSFHPTTSSDSIKTKASTMVNGIKPKKPKPITKEFSAGLKLTTDGWGIFVEKGWVRSEDSKNADKFYNVRVVNIELTEHKHSKELKQTNNDLVTNDKPKPYIYGKINNFYALKLGYGNRKMIAGKPEQGTISIHWVYSGGLSIGLLKPYYLDAYVLQDNSRTYVRKSIKYEDSTKESFLNTQRIVGNAGWSKGLDEIKFVPGIHLKTALHFDFAASIKTKLALEVGVATELYTQNIMIMADQKNHPYLFNGYVSLQFGKRY